MRVKKLSRKHESTKTRKKNFVLSSFHVFVIIYPFCFSAFSGSRLGLNGQFQCARGQQTVACHLE